MNTKRVPTEISPCFVASRQCHKRRNGRGLLYAPDPSLLSRLLQLLLEFGEFAFVLGYFRFSQLDGFFQAGDFLFRFLRHDVFLCIKVTEYGGKTACPPVLTSNSIVEYIQATGVCARFDAQGFSGAV